MKTLDHYKRISRERAQTQVEAKARRLEDAKYKIQEVAAKVIELLQGDCEDKGIYYIEECKPCRALLVRGKYGSVLVDVKSDTPDIAQVSRWSTSSARREHIVCINPFVEPDRFMQAIADRCELEYSSDFHDK